MMVAPELHQPFFAKMTSVEAELEFLIQRYQLGEKPNWETIFDLIYGRLKNAARRIAGIPSGDPSLGASALVNETFIKFEQNDQLKNIRDCQHFFALYALMMRQTLTDYYRKKKQLKNGGGLSCIEFDSVIDTLAAQTCDFGDFQEYLEILSQQYPRPSQALNMKIFLKMSIKEIALASSVSESTVEKDLRFAKAVLRKMISDDLSSVK